MSRANSLSPMTTPTPKNAKTEWRFEQQPVEYPAAVAGMEARVEDILDRHASDLVWFLEHPALYTAGTSAKTQDLLDSRFPVYASGRGGQYTYHGPGQRVVYIVADLKRQKNGQDLRRYVFDLEEALIRALAILGVKGERREGRIGIWVDLAPYGRQGEAKIAAIGVRVRKWITYHGIALNVAPDLSHYAGIVPCGIADFGVTSLADLGVTHDMQQTDHALQQGLRDVFGF